MSRQSKGARLWLEPVRYSADGKLYQRATWIIRDGARKIGTGCLRDDRAQAEQKLAEHIASKYQVSRARDRHPAEILVLDVLNIYLADVAKKHARPDETKQRILTLADFWQPYTLADVNGTKCGDYGDWRTKQNRRACKTTTMLVTPATVRRELEELRAAINYHSTSAKDLGLRNASR
jgi:hypothetical protein